MASRTIDTPAGPLRLAATERGLSEVAFATQSEKSMSPDASDRRGRQILDAAERQLGEYFAGKRHEFDLPLDLHGSDFQQRIWAAISRIPFAATASYKEVAAGAGVPGANRAAGRACGANPVVIIVPCHRVLASDGSLRGYGGGLALKRWLLAHEGALTRH